MKRERLEELAEEAARGSYLKSTIDARHRMLALAYKVAAEQRREDRETLREEVSYSMDEFAWQDVAEALPDLPATPEEDKR